MYGNKREAIDRLGRDDNLLISERRRITLLPGSLTDDRSVQIIGS